MNYVTAKSASELGIEGVQFERVNNTIAAVILDGPNGDVRIEYENYSGLKVLIPAPPKTENRFHLHGEVKGLPVSEFFRTRNEAETRREELGEFSDDGDLDIAEHDFPVDDDGNVVS